MKAHLTILLLAFASLQLKADDRPNIIVVLVDDMGFSDIGCYGGEIQTPNLDQLAANGTRFTQFYNTSRCCPTRASLLTGLYSHQAGMGLMTKDRTDKPGFKGRLLPERCVSIAQVLKQAGYGTYMVGKWHLGTREGEQPLDWGFDRFYGCLDGAFSFFRPGDPKAYPGDTQERNRHLTLDRRRVEPSEDFYATNDITEYAIQFLDQHQQRNGAAPFFMYLAYNAPHWPLQALPEDIAKYEDTYKTGWDEIRAQRYRKQIDLGLFDPKNARLSERFQGTPYKKTSYYGATRSPVPAWNDLDPKSKADMAKRMAVYAAMIDNVDQNIGRLVSSLKSNRSFENTVILFMSDNGGSVLGNTRGFNQFKCKDLGKYGSDESFISYGSGWSNVSNTPFRMMKCFVHEGGISTPLIVHWPRGMKTEKGSLEHAPGHLVDIMATCVELAEATYPKHYSGHSIIPMEGTSLVPLLQNRRTEHRAHEALFWEHAGNKAVRHGEWKLVSFQKGPWELYNIEEDRSEMQNLSEQYPELVGELILMYQSWAKRAYVEPSLQ